MLSRTIIVPPRHAVWRICKASE